MTISDKRQIELTILEEVLLNKCIEHYEGMLHPKESLDEFLDSIEYDGDREELKKKMEEIEWSIPPLRFLRIEMLNAVRRTNRFYKTSFAKCWIYKDGVIDASDEGQDLENDISSNSVYLQFADSSFYWDIDCMKGFVNMFYGPKYGRGYTYDIKQVGNTIILENEQIRWNA